MASRVLSLCCVERGRCWAAIAVVEWYLGMVGMVSEECGQQGGRPEVPHPLLALRAPDFGPLICCMADSCCETRRCTGGATTSCVAVLVDEWSERRA